MTFSKSIFTFATFTAWYLLSLVELEMSQPVLDDEMIKTMSLNLKVFTNIQFKKMLAQPYWHVNCFLQSSCVTIFSTSSASTWTLQILNKLFFLAISDLTKGQTCTIDYFSSECPTDKQSTLCFCFFFS